MRDCSKVVPRRDRSAWTPLGARAWRLREASWRRRSTTEWEMRGWSRGEMRLTERLLSARGRGSRVVVTVMLWARAAGFVSSGVGAEEAKEEMGGMNFHGLGMSQVCALIV